VTRAILKRLLQAILVLWAAITLVWIFLFLIPGDICDVIAGQTVTPEICDRIHRDLGLDRPSHVQYARYLWRLLHADLGISYLQERPVGEILAEGAGRSALLGTSAMLLAIPLGVTAGVAAGRRRGIPGALLTGLTLAGLSMPTFWIGYLLMILFAVRLGILPVSGFGTLSHLVLPALTLAVYPTCLIARVSAAAFREQLAARHVMAARARGLGSRAIVWRHAFRNALAPIVTLCGLLTATLIGGAIATETVFAWPGLGQILFRAISSRDVMVVEGGVILLTGVFIAANLAVDLAYAFIDPRLRRHAP